MGKCPRVNKKIQATNLNLPRPPSLRLGFIPLTDCAPLIMARELGLFRKYNLNVVLSRELGWATIRDKIIHGELDAAPAVAAMPVAATLGLGSIRCDCLTALVLNLHGNAITLSEELWRRGVRDGATLRAQILATRGANTLTFGIVYPFSSHHYLLRRWLESFGIRPNRDVRIVVVPPPQMVTNLKAGHLDGFCVGEPWNSVAVQSRAGWCVATSAELEPGHPEKVLMVRNDFAEKCAHEHLALIAALLEACEFCDAPENREQVISMLARPEFVGVPQAALRRGMNGEFDFGHGQVRRVSCFNVFYRHNANEPSDDKAAWVLRQMRESGLAKQAADLDMASVRRVFRADIFQKALRLRNSTANLYEEKNQLEAALV